MDHTEFKFSFKIQPKADGGYEAICEDPPAHIEGATREEVEQQVRVKLVAMLGPEVAAMLPTSFRDKLDQSGQSKTSFTVKKTFHIGGGLSEREGNVTTKSHTFTIGGTTAGATPGMNPDFYRKMPGDVVSASSSSGDDFGPVRRTGDGSPAMLMLRILVAGIVILGILFLLRR